jgi:hypothetical protein
MKEAFWGILIVMLGLVGIVIVNIFQNVTVGNDRTYYQLKESAEAAAYDAIDLTYYRLNGDIRMVEDKFVENFTRRFAQNIGSNGNFNITIQEITGNPPRISIKVSTGITSLQGDDFGIVNRIDGILETKYKIGEITGFLGITEEEWLERINANGEKDNACNITTYGSEELECIPGDLEFTGWGEEKIPETVCDAGFGVEKRNANYRTCECGKWKEESEEVTTTPVISGSEYIYNWIFKKDGELRDIDEKTTTRAYVEKCTTAIQIYVQKDLRIRDKILLPTEYELCPASGTTVNLGQTLYWRSKYTPSDSSNRKIVWTKPDTDKTISIDSTNPLTDKGYSYLKVFGKELGTTTVTATSTNGKTATCKVTVLDGNVDTVGCEDLTLTAGGVSKTMKSTFTPYTADKINFTWVSADTSIATINKNTGEITPIKAGESIITITAPNGKTGTCKATIDPKSVCKSKSSVGVYYEYDEMYCSGQYCKQDCIKWEKVFKATNVTMIGGVCFQTSGEYSCKKTNSACKGSYTCTQPYTSKKCTMYSGSGQCLRYENIIECKGGYWTPSSCLGTCQIVPPKYHQLATCPESSMKCTEYAPTKCTPEDNVSVQNCKITTITGYSCPSGWTSSGSSCCK